MGGGRLVCRPYLLKETFESFDWRSLKRGPRFAGSFIPPAVYLIEEDTWVFRAEEVVLLRALLRRDNRPRGATAGVGPEMCPIRPSICGSFKVSSLCRRTVKCALRDGALDECSAMNVGLHSDTFHSASTVNSKC